MAEPVRFQRVSDRKTYPVQVSGKPILPGTRQIHLARRVNAVPALMERAGILDCLKSGYPVEPSSFDRDGMRDDAQVTVCLHHAFASIGSAEGIAAWLTEAGLKMGMDGGDGSGGVAHHRHGMTVYLYDFNWKIEGRGPLSGPLGGDLTAGRGLLHSTITYALDQHGMPIHVIVCDRGTRRKWRVEGLLDRSTCRRWRGGLEARVFTPRAGFGGDEAPREWSSSWPKYPKRYARDGWAVRQGGP